MEALRRCAGSQEWGQLNISAFLSANNLASKHVPKQHRSWTEALLVLLESNKQQAEKIRMIEEVIAMRPEAFCQQQQLQDSQKVLEDQCTACTTSKSTGKLLRQLEQRVTQLEQQGQVQHQLSLQATRGSSSAGATADRLQRLEQQVQCLAEIRQTPRAGPNLQSTVRMLSDEMNRQLDNIRSDTKQALAVASKLQAELQAAGEAQTRETERQLKQEMQGIAARLESHLSSTRLTMTAALGGDIDAGLRAAHEAWQQRLDHLQGQTEWLADSKADTLLLTQYTGQVTEMVNKLSSMVVDSTEASIADLANKQKQLHSVVQTLSANKADSGALLQHQQHCQEQFLELQRALAAAKSTAKEAAAAAVTAKRASEPIEGLRLELAEAQGCMSALQAAIAGLESTSCTHSSQFQQHSTQLHGLASTCHMLQQQLFALTNQIDPSAAAVLAAAAVCDNAASAKYCQLMGTSLHSGIPVSDCLQAAASAGGGGGDGGVCGDRSSSEADNSAGSTLQAWVSNYLASDSSSADVTVNPAAAKAAKHVSGGVQVGGSGCAAAPRSANVLRHLPIAARLLLLESGLQELCTTVSCKGNAGDLQTLSCQVEGLSSRLAGVSDSLGTLSSSSSRQLDEQAGSLMRLSESFADLDKRPTQAQMCEMLQRALADAHAAACATAAAASKAAVAPLQQQLDNVEAELQATRTKLQAAAVELDQLTGWQAAFHGETRRVSALDSKLRLLSAEVDRLDGQASTAVQAQDELRHGLTALDASLSRHVIHCTANMQQLHQDCAAVASDSQENQAARLAALEKAAAGQAAAVVELAGVVAGLPSKDGIRDAVLSGSQAAASQLLTEHIQEEQERWEVWLAEFARLMEQRPTNSQIQQCLAKQQQNCDLQCQQHFSSCKQLAERTAETAVTKVLAIALDEGVAAQIRVLDMRMDTLEAGLQNLGATGTAAWPAAQAACWAHCAAHAAVDSNEQQSQPVAAATSVLTDAAAFTASNSSAYASGQLALLLRQVGDVQLQLLSKADLADVEQQLVIIKQAMQECVQRDELAIQLEKKLDLEMFLASVAARQKAARVFTDR